MATFMKAIDSIFEQRWHFPQPKKQGGGFFSEV
jgi:hypothetical protein